MKTTLAALLLAVSLPALGAETGTVTRGDVIYRVKVAGTIVPEGVFRLKSTIEGRVEDVQASSFSWHAANRPLASLADKEMAALIDSRGEQDPDSVENRWGTVFHPALVSCPVACYVLKVYARPRTWVKPQAVLFEAARKLTLVARVSPEDAPLIQDGMKLAFWPVEDPKQRLTALVTGYTREAADGPAGAGGKFSLSLAPGRYLAPGTEWAGEIVPILKRDVLRVPTAALIVHDGSTYLPIRVSSGITTREFTQVTGVNEGRHILILDESQLHGSERLTPSNAAPGAAPTTKAPAAKAASAPAAKAAGAAAAKAADAPAAEAPAAPAAPDVKGPVEIKGPSGKKAPADDGKGDGGDGPYGE